MEATNTNSGISSSDILYILENPWNISEGEWGLQDKNAHHGIASNIQRKLALAANDGYFKIWKTPAQEPIAILGGHKVGEKRYETFFIASKHMDKHAMAVSTDIRKVLQDLGPLYKGCTCGLYSVSEHPNQLKWFKFLGFTYVPQNNVGNSRYFEHVYPED